MGRYIAHKRRKIKRTKEDASTDGAADPAVRGNETAMRREAAEARIRKSPRRQTGARGTTTNEAT